MKNRIGIVGGGQLGRMLGFEAKKMGFIVTVMDATLQSPAGQVVDRQIMGGYSDAKATEELAKASDFLTVEIEHINTETLKRLVKKGVQINPSPQTLEIIKDKYLQKQFLLKHKIPTAPYVSVIPAKAGTQFGFPFLLKKRFDAFDGRGNALINKHADIAKAFEKLGKENLYVEKFVPFVKELAVVVARDMKGNIATYPVVETIHKNNICHIVIAPAQIDKKIRHKAQHVAKKVMLHIKGAGVFAIEMFVTKDGRVLVNEIAPRVHNCGHFTIEACFTSQFEQHIRAITGMPLGNTEMKVPAAVMINILGERKGEASVVGLEKVLQIPNVYVHVYGKAETKPDRKMGHITVVGNSVAECLRKAKRARRLLMI